MTANTETERAEFEKMFPFSCLDKTPSGDYSNNYVDGMWEGFKAARRAPVVPQGLTEAAQAVIERWDSPNWKDLPATANYIARLRNALAAAPQPPEAQTNCANLDQLNKNNDLAAPVQLPDALLTLETDAHYIFNNPPGECPQAVRDVIEWYASSVRQLLAEARK